MRCAVDGRGVGMVAVTLLINVLLLSVSITCGVFIADDNYFPLAPNHERVIDSTPEKSGLATFKAHFEALNWPSPITVRAQADVIPAEPAPARSRPGQAPRE